MPHVAPVDLAASDDARAEIEWLASASGFVANSMLTLSHRPEIAEAVLELVRAVVRNPDETVDPALRWMIAQVTSLSNGCRYCSARTFKCGDDNGVPGDKLEALWEFETSPLFSDAERAAPCMAMTDGQWPSHLTPEDMAELRRHFSEEQIVEFRAVIGMATYIAQDAGYAPEGYKASERHVDFLSSYPPGDLHGWQLWGPMREETNAWHQRHHTGQDTPHATAADGHRNLQLSMAMDLSAKRSEVVALPPDPSDLMIEPS